jgi:geranylgeranyl pyrophosphate synthase
MSNNSRQLTLKIATVTLAGKICSEEHLKMVLGNTVRGEVVQILFKSNREVTFSYVKVSQPVVL